MLGREFFAQLSQHFYVSTFLRPNIFTITVYYAAKARPVCDGSELAPPFKNNAKKNKNEKGSRARCQLLLGLFCCCIQPALPSPPLPDPPITLHPSSSHDSPSITPLYERATVLVLVFFFFF